MKLVVVGQDPSLRHWGIAQGVYDTASKLLTINNIFVIEPYLLKTKQIRQNSLDMESAMQLYEGALFAAKAASATFAEVPVGSQSARAMASYGICAGVLGSMRASGIPFFEVNPTEVKKATVGKATATKAEMIEWAVSRHPEANWPWYMQKGQKLVSAAKAEHQADAIAAIYAGLQSNHFKQLLLLKEATLISHGENHANPTQTS